jgi:hypothetical protein
MADREKVIKELEETKEYIRTRSNGSGSKICRLMDVCNAAIILLKEQEKKAGKWIPVTNGRGGMECSICHDYAPSYQNGTEYLSMYCPNCGAKMEGR